MVPATQIFISTLPDGRVQTSTVYTFAKAGDEIAMHEHHFWHNCQVVSGSVRIYNDEKSITIKAGELAGLKARKKHAIQATEDNTVTVNTNEPGQ